MPYLRRVKKFQKYLINNYFNFLDNIQNKLYEDKGNYNLYLGAKLFNKMLENYSNSLEKKRVRLHTRDI